MGISAITGTKLSIKNFPTSGLQGDQNLPVLLSKTGCELYYKEKHATQCRPKTGTGLLYEKTTKFKKSKNCTKNEKGRHKISSNISALKTKNGSVTLVCKGPPVNTLKAFNKIDMSLMTDSFMAVAIIAAVSDGVTEIFNIAVKSITSTNIFLLFRIFHILSYFSYIDVLIIFQHI